jgi:outer membrane lipopolysaccharide assembly protein LptE/RlpB
MALVKMLERGDLAPEMRELTIQELLRKLCVLISGYLKRGKQDEVQACQALLERYPL